MSIPYQIYYCLCFAYTVDFSPHLCLSLPMTTALLNPTTPEKLTIKQEAFCVYFHATKDRDYSYIKAGFSPKFASENAALLLKNTKIQARLAELQAQIVPSADTINEIVRENIKMLREITQHPIEMPVSAGHKITAARELNLMHQVYSIPTTVNDNRTVNIIVLDEETRKILSAVAQRTVRALPLASIAAEVIEGDVT